ncbi:MAG: Hsp20/alpha crystallin family protein [Bacteroidota bacterium]
MTLIKFEPFKELETLHDRILGIHPFGKRYFDNFPNFEFNIDENFYPRIDISEDKDNINVVAEIPGVKKDDIKITLQDNILTIEGEKKNETEQKEKNYFRSERIHGSFKRCFTLPDLVDSEKVEAKFEDGMLNIQLKKIEQKVKSEKVIELK